MSTRATIIYLENKGLHIYHELLDDTVHLEIERDDISINVVLMTVDEWHRCNKIKANKLDEEQA